MGVRCFSARSSADRYDRARRLPAGPTADTSAELVLSCPAKQHRQGNPSRTPTYARRRRRENDRRYMAPPDSCRAVDAIPSMDAEARRLRGRRTGAGALPEAKQGGDDVSGSCRELT